MSLLKPKLDLYEATRKRRAIQTQRIRFTKPAPLLRCPFTRKTKIKQRGKRKHTHITDPVYLHVEVFYIRFSDASFPEHYCSHFKHTATYCPGGAMTQPRLTSGLR